MHVLITGVCECITDVSVHLCMYVYMHVYMHTGAYG